MAEATHRGPNGSGGPGGGSPAPGGASANTGGGGGGGPSAGGGGGGGSGKVIVRETAINFVTNTSGVWPTAQVYEAVKGNNWVN